MERIIKNKAEKKLNNYGFNNLNNKGILTIMGLKSQLNTGMMDLDLLRITNDYLLLVEEKALQIIGTRVKFGNKYSGNKPQKVFVPFYRLF